MGFICDLFSKTYFETTNPKPKYNRLLSYDVSLSIIIHTLLYICLICLVSCLFNYKLKANVYKKLFIFLICIMILGYIGRLSRSKSIYKYHIDNEYSEDDSIKETKRIMDGGYFRFYFIA